MTKHRSRNRSFATRRASQARAAALVVVMILFFIISLTAAYTNRNLIFEQRTSVNQFKSASAFEAADAGMEWVAAQLNAGRMDNACVPNADVAVIPAADRMSFRQRYLEIPFPGLPGSVVPLAVAPVTQPSCVFDSGVAAANSSWTCNCPEPGTAGGLVGAAGGSGAQPAFLVTMPRVPPLPNRRTDIFEVIVSACTRLDATCLRQPELAVAGDGTAEVHALFSLRGAITRPPAAALTVANSLAALPAGVTLSLTNTDVASNGLTLHVGNSVGGGLGAIVSVGLPGAIAKDTQFVELPEPVPATKYRNPLLPPKVNAAGGGVTAFEATDRRFANFFGMLPITYQRQPGQPFVECAAGCTSVDVVNAIRRNPGRAIWVRGGGVLSINADIGTPAVVAPAAPAIPVLLIVEGDIAFSNNATVVGLIYGRKKPVGPWSWTFAAAGSASVIGAAVSEDDLRITSPGPAALINASITYDADVLLTLRVAQGTFIRVPGSWRDFGTVP